MDKNKGAEPMGQAEFCARFVNTIMRATAHRTDEPASYFLQYAQDTASSYFENEDQRADGPEACAVADMDYWE